MLITTGQPAASTERRFFAAMTLVAAALVFAGFATSYYVWPITRGTHYSTGRPISPTLPLILHLHAALFTGWICCLVSQAALVTSGNVRLHRRLGRIGAVLIPLMVVVGLAAAVHGARTGFNPRGPYRDALSFMFVGVTDVFVFATLSATGLALTRRPDVHRRLMLLGTTGGLLWPAIARVPGIAGRPAPVWRARLSRARARSTRCHHPRASLVGNASCWPRRARNVPSAPRRSERCDVALLRRLADSMTTLTIGPWVIQRRAWLEEP